jgi:hypothetical protein
VDPLPDRVKGLFQGEMTNYIQAVTDREFTKQIPESFYSLGLGVETTHDLEAALNAFAERQIFMNKDQYKSEHGESFDAAKLQKIKVAPPILIFQLKRFSYNRQTHNRAKLHTKFTFPPFVSLEKYMDKPQPVRYSLNGVVLHAGEVNSGHYSSIVRVGHDWMEFNDMEVVPTDEDSLKTKSFGGTDARTVAYLLFYVRVGAEVDGRPLLGEFPLRLNEDTLKDIEQDNSAYFMEQCAFSEPIAALILKTASFSQLRQYYFNVFCHSRMSSLAGQFVIRFSNLMKDSAKEFMKWMTENFVKAVGPVFASCTVVEIVNSLADIIQIAAQQSPVAASVDFFTYLVTQLTSCLNTWRQIPNLATTIWSFLNAAPDRVRLAKERSWCKTLARFAEMAYSGARGDIFLETVDFTAIFDIMKAVVDCDDVEEIRNLPQLFWQVNRSWANREKFRDFLMHAADLLLYSATELSQDLPGEFSPEKILELEVRGLVRGAFESGVERLLRNPSWTEAAVFAKLHAKAESLADTVFVHNLPYLIQLLSGSHSAYVEQILRIVAATNSEAVFDALRKELEANAKTCSVVLRLLLWSLKQRKHPREEVLVGLDRQEPSDDLNALLSYFGGEKLLSQFQAISGEGNIVRRLQTFIPALGAADNQVFDAIIGLPEWTRIVNVLQHVSSEGDFEVVGRLISTLVSRNPAAEPAHSIIVGLILGDKTTHVDHVVRFASYLASVPLVKADIEQVHAAIEKVLSIPQIPKGAEDALGILIPASAELLSQGDPPPNLTLPEMPLVQVLGRKPPMSIAKVLLNYARLCALSNPAFSASLPGAMRQGRTMLSFHTRAIPLIVLGCYLVLANTGLDDADISKELCGWFAPALTKGNDAPPDEMYNFFHEAIFDEEERLKGWGVPFTATIFKDAKLGNATERKFFEDAFAKFPENAAEDFIKQIALPFETYSSKKDRELLLTAKRAALLLGVWPQRREEFMSLVSPDVIESFPRKTSDWITVRSALLG